MKKVKIVNSNGNVTNNRPVTIEAFINSTYDVVKRMSGVSVLDTPIPTKPAVKEFEESLARLVETCDKVSSYYSDETEKIEKFVCDLQHLTVFASLAKENDRPITEFLGGNKVLPPELENVPLDEYGTVLVNALCKRRQLKDTNVMFKVMKERLEHVSKFIQGMDTRTYELRSKEPGELNRNVQ